MNEDIRQLMEKCRDSQKAEKVMLWIADRCRKEGIPFTGFQWKSLANHVAAMVDRGVTGEQLTVDPELFGEVGKDSMSLSREVASLTGSNSEAEALLLSVHFEVAKKKL